MTLRYTKLVCGYYNLPSIRLVTFFAILRWTVGNAKPHKPGQCRAMLALIPLKCMVKGYIPHNFTDEFRSNTYA